MAMNEIDTRARAHLPGDMRITTVGEKLDWFGFDPYFRDGCDNLGSAAGKSGAIDLMNSTFLVFRPDAILSRNVMAGVDVLFENRFWRRRRESKEDLLARRKENLLLRGSLSL